MDTMWEPTALREYREGRIDYEEYCNRTEYRYQKKDLWLISLYTFIGIATLQLLIAGHPIFT